MNEYLLDLIQRYRSKGVLVDTNLLLLFIVGSINPQLIPQISRTAQYSIKDFQLVESFIEFFSIRVTTPHILTETSNLFGREVDLQDGLKAFVQVVEERHVEAKHVVDAKPFLKFGITDTGVLAAASENYLVVTDDGPMYGMLINNGVDVISLATLRKIA